MGALERFPKPTSITSPGVEALSFSYDADNRITGIVNGMNASQSEALGYDALGRLTGVTSGAGNASYAYDADGNTVTLDGKTAYQYGPFDRLTNAGGVAYTVSAAGERLAKVGNGGATYFAPGAGGQLQAEDVNGTWRDYVWLNGRLVTVIASGGVFTVASDQTGRPVALTAPNSHAVVWSAATTPFDRSVASNAWGSFNVGYPGQYADVETGLWHNGNRDYDPATGRYIESDPIGLAGGVNTYVYVGDNPISNVDPMGLCKTCSQLEQEAAQLAQSLSSLSDTTGDLAIIGTIATVASGIAEAPTFGGDTAVTLSAASATAFFGDASVVTGAAASVLSSYANGDISDLANFDFNRLDEHGLASALESLPGVGKYADAIGALAGKAMDIESQTSAACAGN